MTKSQLEMISWMGLLLLLLLGISSASASQAVIPPPASITASSSQNDTKSFIHLPGRRSVDDIINANADVRRGANRNTNTKSEMMRGGAVKTQVDPLIKADYIADTKLPTDMGNFRMRAYRVRGHDEAYSNTNSMEPIIIYAADKPPFGEDGKLLEAVPIRIHDQCLTSEVFRSRR